MLMLFGAMSRYYIFTSTIVNNIHDELVYRVRLDQLEDAKKIAKEEHEMVFKGVKLRVKLQTSFTFLFD